MHQVSVYEKKGSIWNDVFGGAADLFVGLAKQKFDKTIVSSVRCDKKELLHFDFLVFISFVTIPMAIRYLKSHLLGLDNSVAAIGRWALAINHQTASLPSVNSLQLLIDLLVTDTTSCLQSGIWNGVYYEIKGQIAAFYSSYPEFKIFVCGGDSESFVSLVKGHIFVVTNLVLIGLNCILNHNVE